ncbi:hypothetical protein MASR1M12_00670 [Erysipelotrichia bacterium]
MPVSQSLSPILFHGDTIYVVTHQGEPFAPMRPIIEGMGLDWASQTVKLSRNKARWGVVIIPTPSASGQQSTLCLPLRKLAGFLATINPAKVRNDLRAKIICYQNECDDALWNYWTKGEAKRPAASAQPRQPDLFNDSYADRRGDDVNQPQMTESERDLLRTLKELDNSNRHLSGALEETRINYIRLLESHASLLEERLNELKDLQPRERRQPRPITEETKSVIIELARAGLSGNKIAERLQRSTATVSMVLRAEGGRP